MAKTAWNIIVLSESTDPELIAKAKQYLLASRGVMEVYGIEGDEGGPLEEIRALSILLEEAEGYSGSIPSST